MTDKQIINVSDCIYHNNGKCTNSEIGQCNCANVVSCYYKEYKRKEQEVDVLKADNERLRQAFAESDNDCFRLEKENRLLKIYRSITPFKVKMLIQTLNKIKEIAEAESYLSPQSTRLLVHKILQKISEVEDEKTETR